MIFGVKTNHHHIICAGFINIRCAYKEGKVVTDALARVNCNHVTIFLINNGFIIFMDTDIRRFNKLYRKKGTARKQKCNDCKHQQNDIFPIGFFLCRLSFFAFCRASHHKA